MAALKDSDPLRTLIRVRMDSDVWAQDPNVTALVDELVGRFGSKLQAVLLYGSYLRGKRDTLLDFYVLLDNFQGAFPRTWHSFANRILPPNVYYLSLSSGSGELRAKYATLTLAQFERANAHDFHCYFWARFTQPCALVFVNNAATRQRIDSAIEQAMVTFVTRVAPMLPTQFSTAEFWSAGFRLTYAAELRAERPGAVSSLYGSDKEGFDALLHGYAQRSGALVQSVAAASTGQNAAAENRYRHVAGHQPLAGMAWGLRRWQGKVLSILRLIKAAGTFNDPLDYLLWKIERHSGVREVASARQRRYPLIFAWGIIWRLYRRGAFR